MEIITYRIDYESRRVNFVTNETIRTTKLIAKKTALVIYSAESLLSSFLPIP